MSGSADKPAEERQLDSLRNILSIPPERMEIAQLFPLFVPSDFFKLGNWPGPYVALRTNNIGLTWSVHFPDQNMRYVDHATTQYWDRNGIDWKRRALLNLEERTDENPATQEFHRTNGKLYAIALMHADGVGPSRLLLKTRLCSIFPEGYKVALPEMSCALAFSVEIDPAEAEQIHKLIDDCFQKGTRPLAQGIYTPEDLDAT